MPTEDALPPISLLTICGLSEIGDHGRRAVTHVLSILDPEVPDPADFGSYDAHHRITLRFHDAIEPGGSLMLPMPDHVDAILAFGQALHAPKPRDDLHLLVHCHMGISRSTAAMAMLLAQAAPREDEDAILARIVATRAQAWPNSRMIGFADERLGRNGRLKAALCRLYARQLARSPEIATFMNANARSREVAMAAAGARELGLEMPSSG